jgi:hypothetical protein
MFLILEFVWKSEDRYVADNVNAFCETSTLFGLQVPRG